MKCYYLFIFGENEGLNAVADVVEDEIIQVVENGYLFDKIKAEKAFDVPPKPFWQVLNQFHLIITTQSRPSLMLVAPHS